MPIYQPGLEQLVAATSRSAARLHHRPDGRGSADAVFIAVATALRRGDGHADLSYISLRQRGRGRATGPVVIVTNERFWSAPAIVRQRRPERSVE
jgi:UDPglucose 6-dehydrogenase